MTVGRVYDVFTAPTGQATITWVAAMFNCQLPSKTLVSVAVVQRALEAARERTLVARVFHPR